MESIVLSCIQCHDDFEFTVGEQRRYNKMGFNEPHRCPQCRRNKIDISDTGRNRKGRDKRKHYRDKEEWYR